MKKQKVSRVTRGDADCMQDHAREMLGPKGGKRKVPIGDVIYHAKMIREHLDGTLAARYDRID